VNIAARLQSEADPGGILISNTVHDQVRNKLTVGFDFLGDLHVKNIEDAVPAFAIRVGSDQPPRPAPAKMQQIPLGRAGAGQAAAAAKAAPVSHNRRLLYTMAMAAVAVVVINIASWSGTFWAQWPLLVFGTIAALSLTRWNERIDPRLSTLGIAAIVVVLVNAMTWTGTFWAVWPLLGIGIAIAMNLIVRSRQG
jgi:adenylate cyclase